MLMNKLFAALIAAAFVFAAGSTIAQDSAKKQAKSQLTPEEKKAANAAKVKEEKQRSGGDSTQPTLTKEEQAKAKADAKAKKEAKKQLTAEEKKAANAAKQNQSKESAKDTTNKP
jgi:membrane protein involved in colicin uptake